MKLVFVSTGGLHSNGELVSLNPKSAADSLNCCRHEPKNERTFSYADDGFASTNSFPCGRACSSEDVGASSGVGVGGVSPNKVRCVFDDESGGDETGLLCKLVASGGVDSEIRLDSNRSLMQDSQSQIVVSCGICVVGGTPMVLMSSISMSTTSG